MIRFGPGPERGVIKLSTKLLLIDYMESNQPPLVDSVNSLFYVLGDYYGSLSAKEVPI